MKGKKMKKTEFKIHAWGLKWKYSGDLLTVEEAGFMSNSLGVYEGKDPYILSTRKDARMFNNDFGMGDLKIVKVQVHIKEAA